MGSLLFIVFFPVAWPLPTWLVHPVVLKGYITFKFRGQDLGDRSAAKYLDLCLSRMQSALYFGFAVSMASLF